MRGAESFSQFKSRVIRMARPNRGHLIPGNNDLYLLWESGLTPEQVIRDHCTTEAQRARHGIVAQDKDK